MQSTRWARFLTCRSTRGFGMTSWQAASFTNTCDNLIGSAEATTAFHADLWPRTTVFRRRCVSATSPNRPHFSQVALWQSIEAFSCVRQGVDRRSYLLTFVDRRSGYLLVSKVGNRTSGVVRDASVRLLQKMETSNRKTLTFDNGTEFSCFRQIASRAGVKVYFAHLYSSWERGTNENANGLLRQYVPKGSDIRVLPPSRLAVAAVN